MEGIDFKSDSIINLSFGIFRSSRSDLMILRALNTEKEPAAGKREIVTIAKSNKFHGPLKNRNP